MTSAAQVGTLLYPGYFVFIFAQWEEVKTCYPSSVGPVNKIDEETEM